jgi:hypothetical protein
MIKDFSSFRKRGYSYLKEEYYYSDDSISWWRVLESSPIPNDQTTITKDQTKSNYGKYERLISEIQQYLSSVITITRYNGNYHGNWDTLTSRGISLWKKAFNGFKWDGEDSGDIICKSFYKTLVYGSVDEVTLLDRCIQDVSQRPRILQEAWKNNGDKQNLNAWANKYAKSLVDHMDDFEKLCRIDWSYVNSFKDQVDDKDFLNKICPGDIEKIYLGTMKKPRLDSGKPYQKQFLMLISVLNYIRRKDVEVIKKAFMN